MSTLVAQTISNGTVSTSSANVIQGSAKAWVNFNGTGAVAIRGSYNVSSITDNGTGNYTVNFTTAMPNTTYSAVATSGNLDASTTSGCTSTTNRATGSCRIYTGDTAGLIDRAEVSAAIFSS